MKTEGGNTMTMAANCERMTVHVPIKERARFKRIMHALGYEVEKKNAIDRAMDDVMAGRVFEVSSVDELRKLFV